MEIADILGHVKSNGHDPMAGPARCAAMTQRIG
jgi:hypothetical protein